MSGALAAHGRRGTGTRGLLLAVHWPPRGWQQEHVLCEEARGKDKSHRFTSPVGFTPKAQVNKQDSKRDAQTRRMWWLLGMGEEGGLGGGGGR